ncbi:MAG TPA: helicase HerA-like domain-containing protein, partial [Kofleriaceae bacterium]|nr:helicase HerA-like domain-containing protein [Kofleriaceae bacterium]
WRVGKHRIFDYKLTPPTSPEKDLFQIHTYALMHDHQHKTRPDLAVFYLHPKRQLFEARWEQVHAQRNVVYGLLASMVGWSRYDEATGTGLKPPGNPSHCAQCRWSSVCEARLGPKSEGARDSRWEDLASAKHDAMPGVDVRVPPAAVEEPDDPADDPSDDPSDDPADDLTDGEGDRRSGHRVDDRGSDRIDDRAGHRVDDRGSDRVDDRGGQQINDRMDRSASGERLLLSRTGGRDVALPVTTLNTHVAVVGAAGSGKTWMAKAIAEGAIAAGVPVIAIDPQGDLVQFLHRRAARDLPRDLVGPYDEFWDRVEPRVFTPGTSHGIRLALDPIRVPSPQELAHIANPERRAEEELAILTAVAGNLTSLAAVGGETESQRTFLYTLISQLPRTGAVRLRDIVAALREPASLGIEEPDFMIKKPEREKLARRLYSYVDGPAATLFNGGMRLDLDRMITPTETGRTPLNIIYLNALTSDDQKHFFLAALASEIYRWMITSLEVTSGRPNLLFYLDEARDYIPAGMRKPPAKEPLIRLFTQGRKFGVGCLLCTQSPRSVDYNVFGNCSTKIVGRLEAAQDVERVGEWFATTGAVPAWVAARKGAEKGSFVARWPDMPSELEGTSFKSRMLFSAHDGAWSPDRVERAVDETGLRAQAQPSSPARS